MTFENLQPLVFSDTEAKSETLKDIQEDFSNFEKIGLESLFSHFARSEDEV